MTKKFLPVLFLPLLLAGCATSLTNLTPLQQTRNANNLYPVEVALDSNEQAVRWDSIRAHKFDYECNSLGKPKAASRVSPEYTLRIKNQ